MTQQELIQDATVTRREAGAGETSSKVFNAFLLLSTVALAVLCVLLTLENRRLKSEVVARRAAAIAESIKPGDQVTGLTLIRSDASVRTLQFGGDGAKPALVFIMAAGCGYCEEAIPAWDRVLTELGAGGESASQWLHVVAVQTDASEPAELKTLPPSIPVCLAQDARSTWLRRINIEPAAVLIDSGGIVLKTWLGLPDAANEADLKQSLLDAATSGA